jgi:hypothetical protein
MKVIDSRDSKTYQVYDIKYDSTGYPHFIIYKDRQWLRQSAKHFKPGLDLDLIVRCKDCKYRYSSEFCECRPDDAYCSDGELRD